MGFLDIRIEKTERAIKQAFMELRAQKPLEKIKVKELCDLACINKSTFYAHYQDIYALANAMEDEMVEVVVESLPQLTARDVSERTEWLTREMFRAFTRNQTEIGILFSGSRQGLFINRVEANLLNQYFCTYTGPIDVSEMNLVTDEWPHGSASTDANVQYMGRIDKESDDAILSGDTDLDGAVTTDGQAAGSAN